MLCVSARRTGATMPERIIGVAAENDRRPTFAGKLEEKGQELVADRERDPWDSSALAVIKRELALALDQINSVRSLHHEQRRSLLRLECYVNSELMQMEARTPRYSPYRFPEREKLQRRLQGIEHDRMQLAPRESAEMRELHGRLLYLINEHVRLMRRWTSKPSPGN